MSVDDFARQNEAFLTWLESRGASISPAICIADFRSESRGRGVAARRTIEEDEVLFKVPRSAVLLPSTSSVDGGLLRELCDADGQPDPWLGLVLAMCHERIMGPQSGWSAYLDILPRTFDTPVFWSADELAELQASSLPSKIGRAEADEQFAQKLAPLLRRLPGAEQLGDDAEVLQLCHCMASTIMAYAFDIEPPPSLLTADEEGYVSDAEFEMLPKGMVPLADLLNADGTRNNARLFYEDDALVMKSIARIDEGQEIFNDYGELPRSDLLRRYGYLTPEYAAWDVVEVSSTSLISAAEAQQPGKDQSNSTEQRLAYLDEHDVLDASYDISRSSDTGDSPGVDRLLSQLPPELLILLQTLLLPSKAFEEYKQRGKLPKVPSRAPGSVEPPFAAAVAKALLTVVTTRASEYATSLAEDLRLRQDPAFARNRRKAMALEVRIGEKEILADAAESLTRIVSTFQEGETSQADASDAPINAATNGHERSSKRQRLR